MQFPLWFSRGVCFGRRDETRRDRHAAREREREETRGVQRWRLSWLLLARFLRHWHCSLLLPRLLALLAFLPRLVPYPELEFLLSLLLRLLLLLLSRCVRLACLLSFFLSLLIFLFAKSEERKFCFLSCFFRFLISRIIDSCLPCVFDANAFYYCYYYYYYYLSWFFWSWICLLFCLAFFQWIGCME